VKLDHLILDVADVEASLAFYTSIFGFTDGGADGPFRVMRVNADAIILLARRPPASPQHLAFAMTRGEFDAVLSRVRVANVPYGDAFDRVGTGRGPGDESGARGASKSIYLFDPDHHLLEILYYDA
jgi:catechol 2,3-dioxygenase-like lactoylglutathione lyase family enzyme